jgi:TRAF3-interacting protein 1
MVATGFPKNYFSAQQLGSKNLKDKTSKIAFLDKLIYLVGVCHGIEVDVRPSKIVAGAEPLDTNMLLTLFGQAAVNPNLDHAAVIKHCQFGGKIGDNSFMKNFHPKLKSKDGIEEEGEEKHTEQDVSGPEGSNNLNEKPKTLPSPERLSETKDKDEDPIKERKEEKQLRGMDLLQQKIKQCNSDLTITKQTIASIVTKPKCSEKLLKKPPFRFLHDLIMAVNKATGLGLERIYR